MKQRQIILALVATALSLTLLTSCSTMGGLGGIFGSPSNTYPSGQTSTVQGTVNRVDTSNQRIDLTINNSGQGTQTGTIYYDSQTRVLYQNQTYNPSYLQRGDQVDVQLYNSSNGQPVANTITVYQRSASNYPNNNYPSNNYPNNGSPSSDIRGTVTLVDTQAQRIDLSNASYGTGLRNSQGSSSIYYDSNTRVLYQNKNYSPTDLERGDQIDVLAYNTNGRYLADTVTVTRNVRQ
jgi:predicted small secreted protein